MRLCRAPDGAWDVAFPFDPEANDAVRQAGARWNPHRRVWTAPPWQIGVVVAALESLGYTLDGRPVAPATKPALPPATAFLLSLPPHLREPAFKALLRVLHPDAGGDTAATQALLQARSAA